MSWIEEIAGSRYRHSSRPVLLVTADDGTVDLVFAEDVRVRIPLEDLWDNPIAAVAGGRTQFVVMSTASGVDGGGATSGAWRSLWADYAGTFAQVNPLSLSWLTLGGTGFTLAAGAHYRVTWFSSMHSTESTQQRLYNVTAAGAVTDGASLQVYLSNGFTDAKPLCGSAIVSPSVATTYRLDYYCTLTKAANGLGWDAGIGGVANVHGIIGIERLGAIAA